MLYEVITPGRWPYPAKVDLHKAMGFKNAHEWRADEKDWHLPENWQQT